MPFGALGRGFGKLGKSLGRGTVAVPSPYLPYLLADDFDSGAYYLNSTSYNPFQAIPGYSYARAGSLTVGAQTFATNVIPITSAGYQSDSAALLSQNIKADASALQNADMLVWVRLTADSVVAADFPKGLYLAKSDNSQFLELAVHTGGALIGRVSDGGGQIFNLDPAGTFPAAQDTTLLARYSSGSWRFGKYVGTTLSWFGAAQAKTMPTGLTNACIGCATSAGSSWRGPIKDVRILLGAFATDAAVISAVTASQSEVASPASRASFAVTSGPTTVNNMLRYKYYSDFNDTTAESGLYNLDILLPDAYGAASNFQLVVVLGVEPTPGTSYADELQVVRTAGLHNSVNAIFCRVTTKSSPWWASKSDGTKNLERLIRDYVVPWMRSHYSINSGRNGVSLLGYSKGGWGAFALAIRNSEFGYAASWDAPLTSTRAVVETNGGDFGTDAQFNAYSPGVILSANKAKLQDKSRLVHSGYNTWNTEVTAFENLLVSEGVPHTYLSTSLPTHNADAGWMPSVVGALAALW